MIKNIFAQKTKQSLYGIFLLLVVIGLTLHYLYAFNLSDLGLPLKNIYAPGDGRMTIAYFKMIVSGDWAFYDVPTSAYLSAPLEFKAYDFPIPMLSVWLYIKFLSLFTSDSMTVFNLFFLSTYFLNAFVMYAVLRKLRVNLFLAVAVAYLFTFLPFHSWRLEHTFYTGYFFIPLWIYYLLLLHNKKPLFFKKGVDDGRYSFDYSKKNLGIIAVLILSSTWNFYYTFFLAFLIAFTLVSSYLYHKNRYHVYSALLVFAFAVVPFAVNMLPYKVYEHTYGKNLNVVQRNAVEAETLGLKITSLIFPMNDHPIRAMAELKDNYAKSSLLYNESNAAVLGFIGSLGFLILIIAVFFQSYFSMTLDRLAQLNLVALLLSTVGGFGVVFAYLVTPQIRAYNRISIFIAALAFMALAIVINWAVRNRIHKRVYENLLFFLLASVIGAFGIWDMSGNGTVLKVAVNPIEKFKTEFLSDKRFVEQVENSFDSTQKVQIAQFPYVSYPESADVYQMSGYEQIYGYLHSKNIHWSYGAVRGREADAWLSNLSRKPVDVQVKTLEEAGFSGLVINRNGYADNSQAIEQTLRDLLQVTPIVSDNQKLAFFKLNPRGHTIIMPPVFNGFYEWEGEAGTFRWAGDNANILWINNEDKPKEEKISFEMGSLIPRGITVKLNGKIIDNFSITPGVPSPHSYTLILTPGRNSIEFITPESSGKPGGLDTRNLSFSIAKFYPLYNETKLIKENTK